MSNREGQSQSSGVPTVRARGALAALIVEDSGCDVESIVRTFQKMGYLPVWWRQVADADAMKTALVEETWDVVVSEHRIPAFDSFKALAVLGASGVTVPLIMFTGSIPGELALAAFRAGAAELVMDDGFDELGRAVSRCLPRNNEDCRASNAPWSGYESERSASKPRSVRAASALQAPSNCQVVPAGTSATSG
jgi:DNA-binding NtrC family response regulator